MDIFFDILGFIFWPIIIISLIVFFVKRRHKQMNPYAKSDPKQLSFSAEDILSQLFILLALFFLWVTALSLSRNFGNLLSWQTIFFIVAFLGLVLAYYLKMLLLLPLSLIGLTIWWTVQAVLWQVAEWSKVSDESASAIFVGLSLIALLFYGLGRLHEKERKYQRFSLVYIVIGLVSITVTLFILSTKPGISFLGEMTRGGSLFGSMEVAMSLLVFLTALAATLIYGAFKRLLSSYEIIALIMLAGLFSVIAILPEQAMFIQTNSYYYGSRELSATGMLWALVLNLILFFELLGIILLGYFRRESWMINLGVVFLSLFIIVKYFDWFFTFLDKSLFFITAGILFFLVGWFMEKGRKYMIANIKIKQS